MSNSIDDLIAGAVRNNDVLIPFGGVDPWRTRAVHRVHELVRDYGVRGFKFHPSMQAFEPNDRRFYPIYEAITDAGVPALFHTGETGIGAGLPGGHRIKLRYSDPMLLDDVAADFPELTIVMAHPAVPWVDSQIADRGAQEPTSTSTCRGSRRSTFPPQLVRAASRQLRTKVLFGTDYPYIRLDRWRRDFDDLGLDPSLAPLVYKENALEFSASPLDWSHLSARADAKLPVSRRSKRAMPMKMRVDAGDKDVLLMSLTGLVSQNSQEDVVVQGSGLSRGDKRRNAKLARLRELVPTDNAILGIDLADEKQAIVLTGHDSQVLVRMRVNVKAWRLAPVLEWATRAGPQAWVRRCDGGL